MQQFAQGLSQVLYTIAIIELAKTGLEATTFELLVTVGNSALLVNGVISTQMLTPLNAVSCDGDGGCGSHTVSTTSQQSFNDSDGPWRYTQYTLILNSISVAACFIFTPFLPKSKEQCHEWKLIGDQKGNSTTRARIGLVMCVVTILVSCLMYSAVVEQTLTSLNHYHINLVWRSCRSPAVEHLYGLFTRDRWCWMLSGQRSCMTILLTCATQYCTYLLQTIIDRSQFNVCLIIHC